MSLYRFQRARLIIDSEKKRGLRVFEATDSGNDVDSLPGDKTIVGVDVKRVGGGDLKGLGIARD